MKNFHFFHVLIATLLVAGMLTGCRSDVDVSNIDTRAELEMGIALPIGSMSVTLGDFLGHGLGSIYIDSVDNKGVISWKDTFNISRNFHQVDLAQYISEKQLTLNVYDKIPAAVMIGTNKQVTGTGMPVTLDFEMPLKLTGINHPDSLDKERLDSALIEMASFSSIIKTHNLPLEWDWIDQVTMDLGEQIRRPAGGTMVIYDKNRDNYGYNQTIPTKVDNFTINLMKKNASGQFVTGQVVDSCSFTIHFTFTIPMNTTVSIPEDAGFDYKLGVQFIDYAAIWGKFIRSKDMYDEAVVDLSESWGALDFISKSNVPFADPKIDMYIVTRVAGALKVDGDYLYAKDASGNKHYASFRYGGSDHKDFHRTFRKWEYLDPWTSIIGDSTTNMMIPFDKDPERGHIDKMFQNMPQELGYKFNLDFDYTQTPQIRITPNTAIRIKAICTLPFIFNEGLRFEYSDTLKNLDISKASIDSLVADVDVIDTIKTSDVKLVLKAKNTIPLDVYASLRFLDENNQIIMDPDDPSKPFMIIPEDTIRLVPPTYEYTGGNWNRTTPGETVIIASVTKKKMDLMPKIKAMTYTAIINDKSLAYAYQRGLFNVKLTEDAGIQFVIGLTGRLDAIMDFKGNK
ncbi:MAG: hypothetical protein IKG86_06945 [Paludibacteraceae bacterium]|nr:hypothetical protein [Paludibacteraceae bacterium]